MTEKNLLPAFLVSIIFCPVAKADEVDNWLASYEAAQSLALRKIEIRKNAKGELKVRAYGTGHPEDIDWGEVTAVVHKEFGGASLNFVANFAIPKAKELLIINPNGAAFKPSGGDLYVELFTTFNDGRQPEYIRQSMRTPQK